MSPRPRLPTQHFQKGASQFSLTQQGAHLLSWRVNGLDVLYLSPHAALDGLSPIRGGVPVCFPQFNQRGHLPKHGFARTATWTCVEGAAHPTYALESNALTLAVWPHPFKSRMEYVANDNTLTLHWAVHNTSDEPFDWTGALHTYLAIEDIANARLVGLGGQAEWDAVRDVNGTAAKALTFGTEFDRVYAASPKPLVLHDGARRQVQISQSASLTHTVVWNPGAAKCAQLADLPLDGYQHFLCVEAAQVLSPITVLAGETWTGWQRLEVVQSMAK